MGGYDTGKRGGGEGVQTGRGMAEREKKRGKRGEVGGKDGM